MAYYAIASTVVQNMGVYVLRRNFKGLVYEDAHAYPYSYPNGCVNKLLSLLEKVCSHFRHWLTLPPNTYA
eukprot:1577421-Amphidinium_carterae.1